MTIPKISHKKLKDLRERIKPLVRFADGERGLFESDEGRLYFIEETHPRNTTFYIDPEPTSRAEGLEPLTDIKTKHGTGGFFFKPTEADVLAQIPDRYLDKIAAYEIVGCDMSDARGEGVSYATVRLYRRSDAQQSAA